MNEFLTILSKSWLWLPTFYIFGICVGSFLNVYAWRYPQIMQSQWSNDIKEWFEEKQWTSPPQMIELAKNSLSLSKPGSFCPHCKTPIKWHYNIPVLGYFILKGKSACCKTPFSIKYPAYENLTGLISLGIAWQFQDKPLLAFCLVIISWFFMAISLIDLDSMLIPDNLLATFFFILIMAHLSLFKNTEFKNFFANTEQALWGLLVGFMSLYILRVLGFLILKKEAMGLADPKLLAIIGFLTGPLLLVVVLLIASVSSLVIALIMRIGKGQPMPFGPFICIGGLLVILFPQFFRTLLGF